MSVIDLIALRFNRRTIAVRPPCTNAEAQNSKSEILKLWRARLRGWAVLRTAARPQGPRLHECVWPGVEGAAPRRRSRASAAGPHTGPRRSRRRVVDIMALLRDSPVEGITPMVRDGR